MTVIVWSGLLENTRGEDSSPGVPYELPIRDARILAKDMATDKGKAKESKEDQDAPAPMGPVEVIPIEGTKGNVKSLGDSRCDKCCKILFVLLAVITLLKSIAEIVVTVSTAIFTKLYGSEQSSRLVAMILLALLAAVTISMLVNALVAVFRNQARPLHAASIVLFIVALMQAVILFVAVRMTAHDELQLTKSLQTSFQLARESNPRHSGIWASTQSEMACCGVYSPEDYRASNLPMYFAPDVPIACCSTFDPNRSELVQEREREVCKSRKAYYREGCQPLVVEGFKTSAHLVLGMTGCLIIVEVCLSIMAAILVHGIKKYKRRQAAEPEKVQNIT